MLLVRGSLAAPRAAAVRGAVGWAALLRRYAEEQPREWRRGGFLVFSVFAGGAGFLWGFLAVFVAELRAALHRRGGLLFAALRGVAGGGGVLRVCLRALRLHSHARRPPFFLVRRPPAPPLPRRWRARAQRHFMPQISGIGCPASGKSDSVCSSAAICRHNAGGIFADCRGCASAAGYTSVSPACAADCLCRGHVRCARGKRARCWLLP